MDFYMHTQLYTTRPLICFTYVCTYQHSTSRGASLEIYKDHIAISSTARHHHLCRTYARAVWQLEQLGVICVPDGRKLFALGHAHEKHVSGDAHTREHREDFNANVCTHTVDMLHKSSLHKYVCYLSTACMA